MGPAKPGPVLRPFDAGGGEMSTEIGHGPVWRWRKGWFRVRCRCGEEYPCVERAWQRFQAGLAEERRKYDESVDNWFENPR